MKSATIQNHDLGTHYSKLAKQVSTIRWVVPPLLTFLVFSFEFAEHTISHNESFQMDFYVELFVIGVLGPIFVAILLSWIARKLNELEKTYHAIDMMNSELEYKVMLRTQELEKANADLRQLDRLKSEFVSLVSHELRAPLTNVQGGLELVLSNEGMCPPVKDNLTLIQSEVKRLIRLVQRILDVSVLESGQLSLNLGPIALRPLLRKVVAQSALVNNNHPINLNIPLGIKLAVADEERLVDILTNLLLNAIKYSPDGGDIDVNLSFSDDFAYIRIQDSGIGILPEDIPHLTEKFYRGHSDQYSSGYGLGLYFVNELIKAQGGTLTIESEGIIGKGSAFTFSIPLEKETLYESDFAY